MAKGSVDYTVVGSPTIVNGVVSGFSTGNYIKPSSNVPFSASSSWEFVSRFKVEANTTGSHFLADFAAEARGFNIGVTSTSIFWELGSIAGAWQYSKGISYTFDPTIFYSFKLSFDGNLYSIWLKTDTTQWTKLDEYASTTSVGTSYYNALGYSIRFAGRAFNGSIDLNNTYIKVNGQPWFGLCPVEVQKHQLMGPVGYTKVGSHTIKDGVASGFSASDYLQIQNAATVFSNSSTFEIITKFKMASMEGWKIINKMWNTPTGYQGGLSTQNGKLKWYIYNDSVSTPMTCDTILSKDVWYYAKQTKINNVYSVSWSNDGVTWYDTKEVELADAGFYYPFLYGNNQGIGNAFLSIDLNHTYIKINGKLWFYQPQETKYIVKDGKLVWADPHIYIDDNGTKTYATQNIAPVPSGYTFGNTTTPSIGYVDMHTQVFTSAPQGATIGRDE